MAPKTEFGALGCQELGILRIVRPVTLQALPIFKRPVAVLSGHEPFFAFMAALAQFADLVFEKILILCGMRIVAA